METLSAGELCFCIFDLELHRPLIDGKANREKIEDAITIRMMQRKLGYMTQEDVDLAIELVDDLLVLYRVTE
jgi:hypothetical protein